MRVTCVKAVFFSPTGNAKRIVCEIASQMGAKLEVPVEQYDFTLPENRVNMQKLGREELVIFGIPVYAGRVPNKILPTIQTLFQGEDTIAVPIVTFGNRSYDNALIELRNELEEHGFHTVAGAAFVSEHVFSNQLAFGRPDERDILEIRQFADFVAAKVKKMEEIPERIFVRGVEPIPPYYTPLGRDKKPAVFLKAKPKTGEECTDCKVCALSCPMGSISYENPTLVTGICIKCQACVKVCPEKAKYFEDEAFLSHVQMLEETYTRRAENEIFVM